MELVCLMMSLFNLSIKSSMEVSQHPAASDASKWNAAVIAVISISPACLTMTKGLL